MALVPILDKVKEAFSTLVAEHELGDQMVLVRVGPLSPQQAIGSPQREGFALLEGREVIVEAEFQRSFGQAFTDRPQRFEGTIHDVQALSLDSAGNRAIFVSTLNAAAAHLGMAKGTRHCRDDEPERCGSEIARSLLERFGRIKVGLVGFQPAILENLVQTFGAQSVRCSDLNPRNIASQKFGVEVWDGKTDTPKLVEWCQLLLITSSAIVNNTFDDIREKAVSQGKHVMVFGVTGAGVSAFLGLERICPLGH